MFEDMKQNGRLLRPSDSAATMVALLRKQNFKSGDHVDYYDDAAKEAMQSNTVASSSGSSSSGAATSNSSSGAAANTGSV